MRSILLITMNLIISVSAFAETDGNSISAAGRSESVASGVCLEVKTYPEGNHISYTAQLLTSGRGVFNPGDSIMMVVTKEFSKEVSQRQELSYVSDSNGVLTFTNLSNGTKLMIDRTQSFSYAPFVYSVELVVSAGQYHYSSAATPSEDGLSSEALPYTAEMLNPDPQFPASEQSFGQLVACSFK